MERIRYFADQSIRRGCGFGMLGISTAMVGGAHDIVLAMRLGATCVTLMGVILVLKGLQAPSRSYKRTEVWFLLNQRHGLPETRAQQVFGNLLRERYMWHAEVTATVAVFMWLTTFLLGWMR